MAQQTLSTVGAHDTTPGKGPRVPARLKRAWSNFSNWWRTHPAVRGITYALLILVIIAAFIIVYAWSPWWIDGGRLRMLALKDETAALATDRDEVVKIVAGLAGALAVLYTIRRHNIDRRTLEATQRSVTLTQKRDAETVRLTTEAQVTDRYIKAIGLLASNEPDERLGGIYALERLMVDSPRDQSTIVEVLAGSIRRISTQPIQTQSPDTPTLSAVTVPAADGQQRPPADLAAAITVLARRPREENPHVIDLRRTNLAGLEIGHPATKSTRRRGYLASVDLRSANLTGVDLSEIDLTEALLNGADMTRARFRFTILNGADLADSILSDAYLGRASMQRAHLQRAKLTGADLFRSGLIGADFREADLTEARFTRANLTKAFMRDANLANAKLTDATLNFVDLSGADLTGVTLAQRSYTFGGEDKPLPGVHLAGANLAAAQVTAAQLAGAYLTDSTILPSNLINDSWVRARIRACEQWAASLKAEHYSIPRDLSGLLPTPDPGGPQHLSRERFS